MSLQLSPNDESIRRRANDWEWYWKWCEITRMSANYGERGEGLCSKQEEGNQPCLTLLNPAGLKLWYIWKRKHEPINEKNSKSSKNETMFSYLSHFQPFDHYGKRIHKARTTSSHCLVKWGYTSESGTESEAREVNKTNSLNLWTLTASLAVDWESHPLFWAYHCTGSVCRQM